MAPYEDFRTNPPGDFMPRLFVMPSRRRRSRGQSVVEFALVVPVLLLLMLTAIDFGRVFLGWVNLQQMTRIAANHAAEHASAWGTPGDAAEKAKYRQKVTNDARFMVGCKPPNPIPDPIIAGGTQLGAPVTVEMTCEFGLITPIISNILGQNIQVSASTTYPVKEGVVATVPGGGAPIQVPPVAKFTGSPQSGWGPLVVTFTNESTGAPSSQVWNFRVAPGGTGTGTATPNSSLTTGTQTVTYDCAGTPGQTCTFGVSLRVANAGGSHTTTKPDYITVTVPPLPPDPMADFTATPRTGLEPLVVNFTADDPRDPDPVVYTAWDWDLNGDGTFDATGRTPSRNYPNDGVFDITLRVTDSTGAQSTITKVAYIVVTNKVCTVPDFANVRRNGAQARWASAGFTTQVLFQPGQGNYQINYQSITGGTIDPQPGGCASIITVGP
jgi:PKD repeat protein